MLRAVLCNAGYQVFEARDGEEALDIAKSNYIDLVMTDVNMPILGGIDLCRELRSLDNYRFTPVLIVTTEDSEQTKQQGKAAGATGWLVKPFDPDKLLNTIGLLCGRVA